MHSILRTQSGSLSRFSRRFRRALPGLAGGAVLCASLTWLAIHRVAWLGPWLADSARSMLGPEAVAWLEDTAYGFQDRFDRIRYGGQAPKTYWSSPSLAPPAPASSEGGPLSGAIALSFPPATARILFPSVAAEGDGRWAPVDGTLDSKGRPLLAKTMIHPDPGRAYTVLAVVAMNVDGISLHAVPGTVEPRDPSLSGEQRTGRVQDADIPLLLAAFNGGFLTIHGHYGMMVDGHRLLNPLPSSCTIGIYRNSAIRIQTWTEMASSEPDMIAFRQTPLCLAESGKTHAALVNQYNTHWGAAVGGNTVLRRSAMGISEDGKTLYFGMGDSLTARSLAEGMLAAGAYNVAQLDVNHSFPRFVFFGKSQHGEVSAVAPLCPGFNYDPADYVHTPMRRDFFYVTRRSQSSS